MRHITIAATYIDDPGYGIEYRLYLDSDNESIMKDTSLDIVIEKAKDYLTTPEYKSEFLVRIGKEFD